MPFAEECVEVLGNDRNPQVITVDQQTAGSILFSIQIEDRDSNPISLEGKDTHFITKAQYNSSQMEINKELTVTDLEAGEVLFKYTPILTKRAGMWLANLIVTDGDTVIYNIPMFFEVRPSLYAVSRRATTPTIAEVRLAAFDVCPGDNYLLDDIEFKDNEIAWAIRRPIDEWNETPPVTLKYTTENFPHRYNWMKSILSELLRIKALNYVRNHLQFNITGGAVDDKGKYQQYLAIADMLRNEWKEFMLRRKVSDNISRGWKNIGGYG